MSNKKRVTAFIISALALILMAGVLAYYSSTNAIDNKLQTMEYGNELVERFTPKTDWQPGESVDKEVGVTNTGDYNLFVRIKMEEEWTIKDGSKTTPLTSGDSKFLTATSSSATQGSPTDGLVAGDDSVVAKTLTSSGWTYNATDGYWYYNTVLAPGTTTNNLLQKITLAGNTDMGVYEALNYYTTAATRPNVDIIGSDPASGWVLFTGAVPANTTYTRAVSILKENYTGYASATYVLTITSQVLQGTQEAFTASTSWHNAPAAVLTAWGVTKP